MVWLLLWYVRWLKWFFPIKDSSEGEQQGRILKNCFPSNGSYLVSTFSKFNISQFLVHVWILKGEPWNKKDSDNQKFKNFFQPFNFESFSSAPNNALPQLFSAASLVNIEIGRGLMYSFFNALNESPVNNWNLFQEPPSHGMPPHHPMGALPGPPGPNGGMLPMGGPPPNSHHMGPPPHPPHNMGPGGHPMPPLPHHGPPPMNGGPLMHNNSPIPPPNNLHHPQHRWELFSNLAN